MTGVGGAGGFATSVGLSAEPPLRIRPFPEARTPGFMDGDGALRGGAGDFGFSIGFSFGGAGAGAGVGSGGGAGVSSGCGNVVLVPSVQVMVSGAQSSSSSSMSAQLPCACALSGANRLAMWMPYFLSSSSVNFLGSGGGTAGDED